MLFLFAEILKIVVHEISGEKVTPIERKQVTKIILNGLLTVELTYYSLHHEVE